MKRLMLVLTLGLFVLALIACNTPTPTPEPTATPLVKAPLPSGKAPLPSGKVPPRTPVAKTGGKVSQGNLPPASAQSMASTSSAANSVCPTLTTPQTKPSGYIKSLTMAEDFDNGEPINPTNVFKSDSTFHAVLDVQNIPAKTVLKAVWYINDIGNSAYCNKKTAEFEWTVSSTGSGDVYFFHEPATTWPPGTYRVEIYVNDTLDQVANFSVKVSSSESSAQPKVPSASSSTSSSKEPTLAPTATRVSPTATKVPPTATRIPPTSTPVANSCNLQSGQSGILLTNTHDFKVLLTIGGGEWGTHDYWFEPSSKTPIQFPPGEYTATLTIPGKGNYKFSNDRIKFEAGKCYSYTTP